MHPAKMLFKVIQSGPLLAGPRTTLPKAEIHHLWPALGLFIMNAFLMASEIVDRTKPLLPRTIRLVAFEQLPMSGFVFSRS